MTLSDSLNPEESETRCKICFEEKMPLVTLCECTGSIAYVHEDCILDWIALKMEKS
jgi:E3 ubiquitin-protein ligase DOA10